MPVKLPVGKYPTDFLFLLESQAHLPLELVFEIWTVPTASLEIESDIAIYSIPSGGICSKITKLRA